MTSEHGIRPAKTSPKYLESNATSHTSPFSAIAELIDNAYDPDVAATELNIDCDVIEGRQTLQFIDNGCGMDSDELMNMLSFGFSEKEEVNGVKPVGKYGNGFKSGSMRLGKDVLVFTKCYKTMSVGLLSQSYLKAIGADTVLVPIVTWNRGTTEILNRSGNAKFNLDAILKHSLFSTEMELKQQFSTFPSSDQLKNGTKILIWNLTVDKETTKTEIDFEAKPNDLINRMALENAPDIQRSLISYVKILYKKPRMNIFLRRKRVATCLITKSLCKTEVDCYSPKFLLGKAIQITFGFQPPSQKEEREDYGALIYHHNRLILAYEKVGMQRSGSGKGKGVVCVVEADFLTTNHNKQGFAQDKRYATFINALGNKLNEYWEVKVGNGISELPADIVLTPDDHWVQCDSCCKWRRLSGTIDLSSLPDKWHCDMNENKSEKSCDVPQERMEADEVNYQTNTPYKRKVKEARMRKSFTAATSAQSAQDSESKVGVSTVSPCNQAAEQMVLGTELTCRMVLSDKENRSECEPEENLQLPRRPVNRDARRDANERRISLVKRKKRNFDVTGIHQDVMNILRECERFEAATSELRNEPSLPHENFIQTTCSMCGRGRDAGPGKTLADGTSVDWTGDDYRRLDFDIDGSGIAAYSERDELASPFRKRIKQEMRNSSAMAESPELICISSSDEEETDDEAKIYKLGSSVKSLSQRVSNLMGVTVVKKECCSTGVQTELSGDVVSAKPEQEDLVTESQPAAITRSTKSEGGSTPSVIEVDDIHDEDLVIKRAVVNDNSDCEAKLADFQSSVARMIHEMFPQIPILEGPENFEQLKANVEKIHNANMQLMERRMVVKRK